MQSTLKAESKSMVAWDGKGQKRGWDTDIQWKIKYHFLNTGSGKLCGTKSIYFRYLTSNGMDEFNSGDHYIYNVGRNPLEEME